MVERPALSIETTDPEWDASDATLEKRTQEQQRIWSEINKTGLDAVQKLMDYISVIEGQNRRLNRRIDMLETQIRFLDRFDKLMELYQREKK